MEKFAAKAKEPFKTALAMMITYAIALAMDWDNAYWAAFTLATSLTLLKWLIRPALLED